MTHKIITLTKGFSSLVDGDDFERVNQHRWYTSSDGYAWRRRKVSESGPSKIRMHRFIMGSPPFIGAAVDHINRDKLDNRKCNLRWATNSQNAANWTREKKMCDKHSPYRGIHAHKNGTFQAQIRINGKKQHLGYFKSASLAAQTYNLAAAMHYGEFAKLNDIQGDV